MIHIGKLVVYSPTQGQIGSFIHMFILVTSSNQQGEGMKPRPVNVFRESPRHLQIFPGISRQPKVFLGSPSYSQVFQGSPIQSQQMYSQVSWRDFTEEYNGSFTIHLPCLAPINSFQLSFSLESTWGRVGTHLQVSTILSAVGPKQPCSYCQILLTFQIVLLLVQKDVQKILLVCNYQVEVTRGGDLVSWAQVSPKKLFHLLF